MEIMQITKRGVSEVVTIVLIVVVSIAAVAILWVALRPTISATGDDLSATCLKMDVEPVSCDTTPLSAVVKRNAGEGNVNKVLFIFEDKDGGREVINKNISSGDFDALETTDLTDADEDSIALTAPVTLKTAVMLVSATDATKTQVCSESVKAVTCD